MENNAVNMEVNVAIMGNDAANMKNNANTAVNKETEATTRVKNHIL